MNTNPARLALLATVVFAAFPTFSTAKTCTRANSQIATVPEIASHPEKFELKCVVVDGVMSGPWLFESVDGVYLQPHDSMNPSSSGFRLGLDHLGQHANDGYRHVSIVGRVQDCETIREIAHANDGPDDLSMIAGLCHMVNGAYLWTNDLQYQTGPAFVRQMGSYEREDYGNLVPAPADWPHRHMIETLAGQFLGALRASDQTELANIHFRNVGLEWEDDEAELLRFLLKENHTAFASLRRSTGPVQQIILVARWQLDPEQAADLEEDYSSTVCFCREKDCSGRWPIATFDADNLATRPYACTTIVRYFSDNRYVPHFDTPMEKFGLAEPPRKP